MSRFGSSMFYRKLITLWNFQWIQETRFSSKGHVIDEFQFFFSKCEQISSLLFSFSTFTKETLKGKIHFLGRSRGVLRILWHITCFRKKLHLRYLTGFWMRRSSYLGNDVPCLGFFEGIFMIWCLNPLSANHTEWSNTLKQFVGNLPTNCLSVFGHSVGLALKGLTENISFSTFFSIFKKQSPGGVS